MQVILLSACQNRQKDVPDKLTKNEQQNILNSLSSNMRATTTDLNESDRKPTNEWLLYSHYPLSAQEIKAMEAAEKLEGSHAPDMVDHIGCVILHSELKNEKGEKVMLADTTENPLYLQRFGLGEYDKNLSQKVGITIRTNQFFSELKGKVQIRLEMEDGVTKLAEIPVSITINDQNEL
ncbi:hypothetical protein [Pedobacter terrae]|nr:hypothetical protein [Pedobacter terrae]